MKTILITGANKGIGYEIACQLGKQGHKIILTGRNAEKLDKAATALKNEGIDVMEFEMDVSYHWSIQKASEDIKEKLDKIDVIINNAGVLFERDVDFLSLDHEKVEKTVDTNILGPFWVIQVFLPFLQKGSRIVNVSSAAGQVTEGLSGWAPIYSMTKSALNLMTRQLNTRFKDQGIIINSMCPGWTKTEMGGSGAHREVDKAAETAVWLATEAPDNLSGKFIYDKKEIYW